MSGIDKIKDQIISTANLQREEMIKDAQKKAGDIIKKAHAEADAVKEDSERNLMIMKKNNETVTESSANLSLRQAVLKAKQEIIAEVTSNAYQKILNMPDKEYFDLLLGLLEKKVKEGRGVICFNSRDLGRLTDEIKDKIRALASKVQGEIIFDDSPVRIDGGFILKYGGIEENMSLEAVFRANKSLISETVDQRIFR